MNILLSPVYNSNANLQPNIFHRFLAQQVLIKCLDDAANAVKTSDNKMKLKELTRRMGELDHQLNAKHTLIPLYASILAKGVDGR